MAESNVAINQYLGARHRFADFFNVSTFGGRQIIKPDQLKPIDSESGIIAWCNKVIERNLAGMSKSEIQTAKRTLWRHRDIVMEWNNGTYLSLLACETQDTQPLANTHLRALCLLRRLFARCRGENQMSATQPLGFLLAQSATYLGQPNQGRKEGHNRRRVFLKI